jgi:hypothetical protein
VTPLAPCPQMTATPVARLDVTDVSMMRHLKGETPVVLTHTYLVDPAVDRWDADYLRDNVGDTNRFSVRFSNGYFMYADELSNAGK